MVRDSAQQKDAGSALDSTKAASAALQAEATTLRAQPADDNAHTALVTVQPKDTIRSIGRFLYQRHLHRAPTDDELKAFVDDTARRNKLTDQQRDNLALDQSLRVKIPGSPAVVAHKSEATSRVAVVAKEAPKPVVAHKVDPAPKVTKVEPAPKVVVTQKLEPAAKPETPRAATQKPTASAPVEAPRTVVRSAGADQACSGYANQIGSWITHNEAGQSKFAAYNPDDAGSGISVGIMQWNQKRGKLPDLIKAWHAKNPSKFEGMFGTYSDELLNPSWVRSANFVGNGTLANGITRALNDREFQQVQLNMRNGHIQDSCELASSYRFTSVRGTAVVADLVNQIGPRGTARALAKVPTSIPNESVRIEQLKRITGWRTNSGDRVGIIEDRVREIWRAEAARSKGN